jgi:hypothetical protein
MKALPPGPYQALGSCFAFLDKAPGMGLSGTPSTTQGYPGSARHRCVHGVFLFYLSVGSASELSLDLGTEEGLGKVGSWREGWKDRMSVASFSFSYCLSSFFLLPHSFSSFEKLIVNYLSDGVNTFNLKNI